MSLSFGTSGVRGLVSEFTEQQVYLLVSSFLKYADTINDTKIVVTGSDLRESSPRMLAAVHRSIADHSKTIFNCGSVPTPCLAYFSKEQKSLAIMVTGSHIPADRNGIKFYLESGETLKHDDQAIFSLYLKLKEENYRAELFNLNGDFKSNRPVVVTDAVSDCQSLYSKRYTGVFKPFDLSSLKVLFYEHSSVARDLGPSILEQLGAEVVRLGRSDTFIPVDTEAVNSLTQFQKWLTDHKADVLVSTDGDGDRPLVIDERGQIVQGDKLGFITSQFLGIRAVALPISCNSGVADLKEIEQVVYTKIGSPFVVAALDDLVKKYESVAGFEANGGYILKSNISIQGRDLKSLPTRDSILPILCLLAEATQQKKSVSEVVNRLPQRFTSSVLIKNCPIEFSTKIIEQVSKYAEHVIHDILGTAATVVSTNTLDGVRIKTSENEIIHFRPSGNAPEFRCYIESDSQIKADVIAGDVKKTIELLIKKIN